jgi:hypothetical protein
MALLVPLGQLVLLVQQEQKEILVLKVILVSKETQVLKGIRALKGTLVLLVRLVQQPIL